MARTQTGFWKDMEEEGEDGESWFVCVLSGR